MRYVVKSGGEPPRVITEADGMVRIHVEGQPEALDLVMTSEQFDAFLGQATDARSRRPDRPRPEGSAR